MAIRAVIFDLGGVLIDIDWERFRKDNPLRGQENDVYPYDYEQVNTGLAQFVRDLRSHYKIATICNGGSREAANRKFGLEKLVDLMIFDGEEGVSKPDARIYQLALVRLGMQPHEVVFVDDKERNVEAAQRLGIYAVLFKNTVQAISEVQKYLEREQIF
ncbi:HAD-IA family hydrolase [Ktedonobacter racemifer]|uniref:HAD-superfamily hydrolase, subfamily IA, variant 3 n=1 Tax=Ktedonobacter racemifer DSM 44963 TaxID=485913 RepID=D6TT25_KTERA|nr:HAD-IA family hydrolase [Ktedonobacter racemifer]EFH83576.1 HAD-superfamily hydrolase, subfamily IA, variant 3 [Ktedonobacter racemifer DSM 44963]